MQSDIAETAKVVPLRAEQAPPREDVSPLFWQCAARLEVASTIAATAIDELGALASPELCAEVHALARKLALMADRVLIGVVPHNAEGA